MKFGLAALTWHLLSYFCVALELKFDLGESRKDCFYEEIDQIGENIDVVFHVSQMILFHRSVSALVHMSA